MIGKRGTFATTIVFPTRSVHHVVVRLKQRNTHKCGHKRSVADCGKSSPERICRRDRGRCAAPDYGNADKDRLCWFGCSSNQLALSGVGVNNEIYCFLLKSLTIFMNLNSKYSIIYSYIIVKSPLLRKYLSISFTRISGDTSSQGHNTTGFSKSISFLIIGNRPNSICHIYPRIKDKAA